MEDKGASLCWRHILPHQAEVDDSMLAPANCCSALAMGYSLKCFTCIVYLHVTEKRKYRIAVKMPGLGVILSLSKSYKEALHLAKEAQRVGARIPTIPHALVSQ